ncbi:MAG TPA: N-formylglutamate amidohydrolase [Legionella sp.]|nr:N-formylglutamate amidohydrolase [Legionella sp.]
MKPITLHISCEHAVNTVPPTYHHLFAEHASVLNTHRAIDIGAFDIANHLRQRFACSYTQTTVSRLLIDCSHSLTHPHCFSEFTKTLSPSEKQQLINLYYQPFRQKTAQLIQEHIEGGAQVLHLSIRSFPMEVNGVKRNAGIGLLYDHTRHGEQEVARIWKSILLQQTPTYRVRMNYPHHGHHDGLPHALRKKYSEHDYLGLEVECNQALLDTHASRDELAHVLSSSLQELLLVL